MTQQQLPKCDVNHELFKETDFDWNLQVTKSELPDPQVFHSNEQAPVLIQKVGVSNIEVPMNLKMKDGSDQTVHAKVSAYVSLDDTKARGINMSRLAKAFYKHVDGQDGLHIKDFFTVVQDYITELPAKNAYLKVRFNLPLQKRMLRDAHMGWIYYPVVVEISQTEKHGLKSFFSIDYVYSSSCPCSAQLAAWTQKVLGSSAISHSQRSEATIKVEFDHTEYNDGKILWFEDVIDMLRTAVPTELLGGVVGRISEQSMADLSGSNTMFVEDSLRRFYKELDSDCRIKDFEVSVKHLESLNQNSADGYIAKGVDGGLGPKI